MKIIIHVIWYAWNLSVKSNTVGLMDVKVVKVGALLQQEEIFLYAI